MAATNALHFDSIADMRATLAADWRLNCNSRQAGGYNTGSHGDASWYGIAGGAEGVQKALRDGYAAGEAKLETLHQSLKAKLPKAIGLGRKIKRGDQGDELDIHAVYRGDVDMAWTSRQRQIKRGKTSIRIVVDIGGNHNVGAKELLHRGLAGLCLAEIMTAAGYRCELVAGFAVSAYAYGSGGKTGVVTCTVKAAGTGADKGLLAASLCLSGFFRTLGFAAICRLADNEGNEVSGGLGHSVQLERVITADARVTQIIVPHNTVNEAAVMAWVTATVRMLQGITAVK